MQKEISRNLNTNIMGIEKKKISGNSQKLNKQTQKLSCLGKAFLLKKAKRWNAFVGKQNVSIYKLVYIQFPLVVHFYYKTTGDFRAQTSTCVLDRKLFLLPTITKVWRRNGVKQNGRQDFWWLARSPEESFAGKIFGFFGWTLQIAHGSQA